MARTGETIENPATGERIEFRQTADDTGGDRLVFEYVLEPGAAFPAEHVHPNQREICKVRKGTLEARVNGDEGTVPVGQTLRIPSGLPHTLWNASDRTVRAEVELQPALRTEELFETMFGLARDGELDDDGRPSPLQAAVLADEFSEEMRVAGPPRWLQRTTVAALARVGRAVGYRGTYPEYVTDPPSVEREPTP